MANKPSAGDEQAGHGATAPSHPFSPATGAHRLTASNAGDSIQPSGLVVIDSLRLQEFIQPPFKAIQIGGHHYILW